MSDEETPQPEQKPKLRYHKSAKEIAAEQALMPRQTEAQPVLHKNGYDIVPLGCMAEATLSNYLAERHERITAIRWENGSVWAYVAPREEPSNNG